MGAAMDAMSLGGVVRQAVKLLRGIDVKLEEAGGRVRQHMLIQTTSH
jgi:hypothetical protein